MGFQADKEQKKLNELEAEVKALEKQKGEFMDYFSKKQKECEKLEVKRLETLKAIELANKELTRKKAALDSKSEDAEREMNRLKELSVNVSAEMKRLEQRNVEFLELKDRAEKRDYEVSLKESRVAGRENTLNSLIKKIIELAG